MDPFRTEYDDEYAAEYSAALAEAARARNDANRQPVRRRGVLFTESGRYCPYCRWELDDAGGCDPQCDGVLS